MRRDFSVARCAFTVFRLPIGTTLPQTILSESMGIPNYPIGPGTTRFSKGIVGRVALGGADLTRNGWTMRTARSCMPHHAAQQQLTSVLLLSAAHASSAA